MSAKHTLGPWLIEHDGAGIYVVTAEMLVASLAPMDPHPTDSDEFIEGPVTEANARLIAAAPELLQALAAMVTAFAWGDMNDGEAAAIKEARAAIAKATGSAA